jgi:hypothetical protein
MDKKELKWYVTPAEEIIDLHLTTPILAGSPGDEPEDVQDEEDIDFNK